MARPSTFVASADAWEPGTFHRMRLEYFEMVDALEVMDTESGTVVARSTLPTESPVFDGHFPNFPILPGVLMLEIMGHPAGYLLYVQQEKQKFVFLGAVKRARFRRMVEPGAELLIKGKVTHNGTGYAIAETQLIVNDELAADAELVFIISDFPNDEVKEELKRRFAEVKVPDSIER